MKRCSCELPLITVEVVDVAKHFSGLKALPERAVPTTMYIVVHELQDALQALHTE